MLKKFFSRKSAGLIDLVMSPLFVTVLILVGVLLPLLWHVSNVYSHEYYEAIYLSRDIGLVLNTLYSINGYTFVEYPNSLSNFTYDFKSDGLLVYTTKQYLNKPATSFSLLQDKQVSFVPKKFENIEKIYLSKDWKEIKVSNEKEDSKFPVVCPKESKYSKDDILISYEESTSSIINSIPRIIRGVAQLSFSPSKDVSEERDLVIRIMDDKEHPKRISVGYARSKSGMGYFSCNLLSDMLLKVGEMNIEEANYFPFNAIGDEEHVSIIVSVGDYFVSHPTEYNSKIGEAIHSAISKVNKE